MINRKKKIGIGVALIAILSIGLASGAVVSEVPYDGTVIDGLDFEDGDPLGYSPYTYMDANDVYAGDYSKYISSDGTNSRYGDYSFSAIGTPNITFAGKIENIKYDSYSSGWNLADDGTGAIGIRIDGGAHYNSGSIVGYRYADGDVLEDTGIDIDPSKWHIFHVYNYGNGYYDLSVSYANGTTIGTAENLQTDGWIDSLDSFRPYTSDSSSQRTYYDHIVRGSGAPQGSPSKVYDSPSLSVDSPTWTEAGYTINMSVDYSGSDVSGSANVSMSDQVNTTVAYDSFGNGNIQIIFSPDTPSKVVTANVSYEDTNANEIHYKERDIGVDTYKYDTNISLSLKEYMEFNTSSAYSVTYNGFFVTNSPATEVTSSQGLIATVDPVNDEIVASDTEGSTQIEATHISGPYKYVTNRTVNVMEDTTNSGRFKVYTPNHLNHSEQGGYSASFDSFLLDTDLYIVTSNNTDLATVDPINDVIEATSNTSKGGTVKLTGTFERDNVTYTDSKLMTVGEYDRFNKPDMNLTIDVMKYYLPGESDTYAIYSDGVNVTGDENATVTIGNSTLFSIDRGSTSITATSDNIKGKTNISVLYSGEYHTYTESKEIAVNYQKSNVTLFASDYFDHGEEKSYEVTYDGEYVTTAPGTYVYTNDTDLLTANPIEDTLVATSNESVSGRVKVTAEYDAGDVTYVDTKTVDVGQIPDGGESGNNITLSVEQYYLHGDRRTYTVLFNGADVTDSVDTTLILSNTTLFSINESTNEIVASSDTSLSGLSNLTASYAYESSIYENTTTLGLDVTREGGPDDDGRISTFGVRGPGYIEPNSTAPIAAIWNGSDVPMSDSIGSSSTNETLLWFNESERALVSIDDANESGHVTVTFEYIKGPAKYVDELNVTVAPLDMEHVDMLPPLQKAIAVLANHDMQMVFIGVIIGAMVASSFGPLAGIVSALLVMLTGFFMGRGSIGIVVLSLLALILLVFHTNLSVRERVR